tara:strand:+ start:432 stop:1211 length:780 start_codon:yes stop_codon:yes gene_type:complete
MDFDNCTYFEESFENIISNTLYNNAGHYFKIISILFGIFITSGTISLIITSNLLFKNIEKEYKFITGYDTEEEEYFNSKFLEKYDQLEDKIIQDFSYLSDKVVYENSPNGLVILGYNHELKGFYYYSDYKDIPYNFLDVISRKFVIENDCKSLLVNTKNQIINAINENKQNNIDQEISNVSSVFANLKSDQDKKKKKSIDYNLKIIDNKIPVPENSNLYIYKGKIIDYNDSLITKKNENINPITDFENIDYSFFKTNYL